LGKNQKKRVIGSDPLTVSVLAHVLILSVELQSDVFQKGILSAFTSSQNYIEIGFKKGLAPLAVAPAAQRRAPRICSHAPSSEIWWN